MKKILLIEDNYEIRENTAEILELADYSVITAENGRIGVEKARQEKPDLIVCDIMMPVMDGYGVLHLLSKTTDTADIPFIFLTAKADRTDLRKGMEMGADDYITKPFDDVELLNAIESRLKKAEMIRKNYSQNLSGLDQLISDVGGEEELAKLAQNREVRVYKKKSEIYREGDFPLYLFYVIKGKVKTYKTNDYGKELIINIFDKDEYLGYVDLLQESSYTESATAMEDCEICLIPKNDFNMLVHRNTQVTRKFMELLSKNIKSHEEQLIKLAYNSVRKRVAEALLKFHSHLITDNTPNTYMKISREDLSNIAGTSLETAIRMLSDFKDEKLIDIETGKVKILHLEKLKNLKN
ncbi:response regulator [Emticicia sp. CRIBPO]|uniref:response regulator n=1 Tax=Emticicia sp. CRIBPO TaxID=2683258 RepID=UPI001411BD83|nr:response regulator [Emticicia sp. CRIBPO]NBA85924.1 response regulator [Emticicia sp. CRIBPO]